MSSFRDEDTKYVYPETIHIAAGVTMMVLPMPGQLGLQLKYVSGGSLSVVGSTFTQYGVVHGCTYAVNNIYTLGTSEILSLNQSGPLYLMGTGATVVANMFRRLSSGVTLVI